MLLTLIITVLVSAVAAQQLPFDPQEATISTIHDSLFSRASTCRSIVSSYLARIERFNPLINAIIMLNPEALNIADSLDHAFNTGNATGALFCIPILLKDNFDATPMPTTGGCAALNASTPTQDGPVVTALRRAGAVILGKTNMHELALEGLTVSSHGGQTINPYDSTRTPGGSSGGTGAAIAASFAVFGTGTDTVNSLRSPASANNLFSFRPTRGLISRAGIIPVSYTQDTVGAIGRSLVDIATALTVMASPAHDPQDNATFAIPPSVIGTDYTTSLLPSHFTSLSGVRLGIIRPFINTTLTNETTAVVSAMTRIEHLLTSSGATLISLNNSSTFNTTALLTNLDVQKYEYRESLTTYLSSPNLTGPHPHSMADLYLSHSPNYLVIPHQHPFIHSALSSSTSSTSYATAQTLITNLTHHLHSLITTHSLSALLYPQQTTLPVRLSSPSQSNRNGILAALTGSPVITMPIGFSEATETAPMGVPVGMEIMGLPWTEGQLLGVAKAVDERMRMRRAPVGGGLGEVAEYGYFEHVPIIKPVRNIDRVAYPPGVF